MSTDDTTSDDGFRTIEPQSEFDDDDVPILSLEPGEKFQGTIYNYEKDKGFNGLAHVRREDGDEDRIKYWLNGQVRKAFDKADVETGDRVRVVKTEEERSYTDDDGEEQSYNVFRVQVDN